METQNTKHNDENKMRCNKCNALFDIKDARIEYNNMGVRQKVCPECGWMSFKAIELPQYLDKYSSFNDDERYYIYNFYNENKGEI